jgi:RNA polymerase sigma-70 factor (ECF subfamily)
LSDTNSADRFRQLVLCHLDDAYNLARWLMRDGHDAEDVVQEAYLRALKAFDNFRGEDARAWLMMIVRNACYTALKRGKGREQTVSSDEVIDNVEAHGASPLAELIRHVEADQLRSAIEELPVEFREVLVMKDMNQMAYLDIAKAVDVPIGTVMSRLSRARARLADRLCKIEGMR